MKPNKVESSQKTFFFERQDGSTFPAGEQEAWSILNNRNQVIGQRHSKLKLIGVSDGRLFQQAVLESHDLAKTNPEAALKRLKLGEEQELEQARGKIERPRNFDTVGQNGRPVKISDLDK